MDYKIGGHKGKSIAMKDPEKQSKLRALAEAKRMAEEMMSGGLKAMKIPGEKKVTVSSNTKQGLEEGLKMAEHKLGELPSDDEHIDEEELAQAEGHEDAQEESEPMDEQDLEAEIERLMKLKEKLSR